MSKIFFTYFRGNLFVFLGIVFHKTNPNAYPKNPTTMSDCIINIPFTGSAESVLTKAKAAIESKNGIFTGNENAGEFEVTVFANTIKGNYSVSGNILNLVITHKPFFVPCSTIENLLVKEIS